MGVYRPSIARSPPVQRYAAAHASQRAHVPNVTRFWRYSGAPPVRGSFGARLFSFNHHKSNF